VARLFRSLANGDVGHHWTLPSLAGSWSLDFSRSAESVCMHQQRKLPSGAEAQRVISLAR
tara:strand:+ start:9300 stop:9479 length:180 start_codon:yes stop_codon:yes gene_type:complete